MIEAVRQFADMREAGIDFDQSGIADDRGTARRCETKDAPSEAFDAPEIENGMLVDAAAEASNAKRPRRSMFALRFRRASLNGAFCQRYEGRHRLRLVLEVRPWATANWIANRLRLNLDQQNVVVYQAAIINGVRLLEVVSNRTEDHVLDLGCRRPAH